MNTKHIVLIVIIAAALVGFRVHNAGSVVEPVTVYIEHNDEKNSAHAHDHMDHETADTHEGHNHSAHDEEEAVHQEAAEAGHDGHEDACQETGGHDRHEGHEHEDVVELMTAAQAEEAGLTTDIIKTGSINRQIKLTGEVRFNQDRIIHLVPRIAGVVASVSNNLGDHVEKGDVLAIIHSRELTDIKSEYLSAIGRIENAKINFEREAALWEKKIIPERQYLAGKQIFVETRIALQAAERKLHALGFSERYISGLPGQPHETLFLYQLIAPADGVIIEKHIVQGELVTTESPVFIVADTTSLWIDLQVYLKDLPFIETGQKVLVSAQDDKLVAKGVISFLSPVINRETRTALARVELSTADPMWRAGLFATAVVTPEQKSDSRMVAVPTKAIQTIEGRPTLFILTDEGYVPRTVKTGRSNNTHVEIVAGVNVGETYVSNGSFELKAKMVTSAMDGHAGHGH